MGAVTEQVYMFISVCVGGISMESGQVSCRSAQWLFSVEGGQDVQQSLNTEYLLKRHFSLEWNLRGKWEMQNHSFAECSIVLTVNMLQVNVEGMQ